MADGYAVARAEQAVRRARLSATTQSSGGRSKVYLMPTMGSSSPRQVVYAPNGIGQGHTERVMLASESPLDTVPRSSNASMASLREKFEARESSPSPFIARKTASNASSRQEHRVGGGAPTSVVQIREVATCRTQPPLLSATQREYRLPLQTRGHRPILPSPRRTEDSALQHRKTQDTPALFNPAKPTGPMPSPCAEKGPRSEPSRVPTWSDTPPPTATGELYVPSMFTTSSSSPPGLSPPHQRAVPSTRTHFLQSPKSQAHPLWNEYKEYQEVAFDRSTVVRSPPKQAPLPRSIPSQFCYSAGYWPPDTAEIMTALRRSKPASTSSTATTAPEEDEPALRRLRGREHKSHALIKADRKRQPQRTPMIRVLKGDFRMSYVKEIVHNARTFRRRVDGEHSDD